MIDNNLDLGQHFMVDDKLLDLIVSLANIKPEDKILEIGSGKGALTKRLASKTKNLICVEKDPSFNEEITKIIPSKNFYNEDILKIINSIDFNKVVANIPYHISEPLLKKILLKEPSKIVMVTGKTFANKLTEDSIIGLITQEKYSVSIAKTISPKSFNPPPKVFSALIVLEINSSFGILNDFFEFSKSKVKNYVLKKLENKITKREIKELLDEKINFQHKKLFSLNFEEVRILKNFLQEFLNN